MEERKILKQIRENERKSHIAMYSNHSLYKEGSWLTKPIKTVVDLFPYFDSRSELTVLDLGCGIGRNCISIARHFQKVSCHIDCVDILDLAIDQLEHYAKGFDVAHNIHGIVRSIDDFLIPPNHYDWILAVSALEHIDSKESFINKLMEISNGIRKDGIVCLVINSNIREYNKTNAAPAVPQFEVNLETSELQNILNLIFCGWKILK